MLLAPGNITNHPGECGRNFVGFDAFRRSLAWIPLSGLGRSLIFDVGRINSWASITPVLQIDIILFATRN